MQRSNPCHTILATLPALLLTGSIAFADGAGGFEITSSTVDGGGGTSTSAGFELTGTIGQPDASPAATSDAFELTGGFWAGPDSAPPCEGDTNGDNSVNVDDLVAVILDWATDGSGNNGNVDGIGIVDVDDLVYVILRWGDC